MLVISETAEVKDEAIGRQRVAAAQCGAFVRGGARVKVAVGGDGDGADARFGQGELLLDIGGGGGGIGQEQIRAAGGRADKGDIEALAGGAAVTRQHQREHIVHGADQRHRAAQRRPPVRHMGQLRAATGDQGREGALLKIDLAGRAAGAARSDDFDGGWQSGRRRLARRQDEREAQARLRAQQGRQQLQQVTAAAHLRLPGEPAIDGDAHDGIVARPLIRAAGECSGLPSGRRGFRF